MDYKNNIVKVSVLPNLIYKAKEISVKGLLIPVNYFVMPTKMILKFIWKAKKGSRIINTIFKKNKLEDSMTQLQRFIIKLQ